MNHIKEFFQSLARNWFGEKSGPGLMVRQVTLNALPPAVAPSLDVDGIRGIFDMAENGQTDDLFRLYAELMYDADVMAGLAQRKAGFIAKPWSFEVPKNASAVLRSNTEFLKSQLKDHAGFHELLPHLPTGGLWPVAVARMTYKPGRAGNYYDVAGITPVPWTRLDFTGGMSERPAGTLGIKCLTPEGQFSGGLEFPERERNAPATGWVVHRGNVLSDFPDSWGGPLRAAVMWWFFALQVRQLWVNYAERGSYLLVGKHEANDTEGRNTLLSAFAEAQRVSAVAVSNETNVEVVNLSSQSGGAVYEALIKYCSNQIVKVFLGTTMTVNASSSGFGGNQSAVQQDSTGDIFVMDTVFAERTIRAQVFRPLLELNGRDAREMPGISWGGKSEDQAKLAVVLKDLKSAGLRPTAPALAELGERLGIALELDVMPGAAAPAAEAKALPEPGAAPGASAPAAATVAEVSLNGAQITALLGIVEKRAAGGITEEGALALIGEAFPSVSPDAARRILAGAQVQPQPGGQRTFAADAGAASSSRLKLIEAALAGNEGVVSGSVAAMARAGRAQFAGLDAALRRATTVREALAATDDWLSTFNPGLLAGPLEECCSATAANGWQKSGGVAGLPP